MEYNTIEQEIHSGKFCILESVNPRIIYHLIILEVKQFTGKQINITIDQPYCNQYHNTNVYTWMIKIL